MGCSDQSKGHERRITDLRLWVGGGMHISPAYTLLAWPCSRCTQVMERRGRAILFIDDIHNLVPVGGAQVRAG